MWGARSDLIERNCGRRRESRAAALATLSIFSFPSTYLWPYEGYVCVGKSGEENVDALNERLVG